MEVRQTGKAVRQIIAESTLLIGARTMMQRAKEEPVKSEYLHDCLKIFLFACKESGRHNVLSGSRGCSMTETNDLVVAGL